MFPLLSFFSFFAIAFANYVEMQDEFQQSFADWLKVRPFAIPRMSFSNTSACVGKNGDLEVSRHLCRPLRISEKSFHSQITFLRKVHGSRLNVFAPINDLSALSRSGVDRRLLLPGQQNDVAIAGGQILGDEYSDHVIGTRSGIILREGCVYLAFVHLYLLPSHL